MSRLTNDQLHAGSCLASWVLYWFFGASYVQYVETVKHHRLQSEQSNWGDNLESTSHCFMVSCIYYAHLTSVRFQNFECHHRSFVSSYITLLAPLFYSLVPTICNHTSYAQVHDLQQSHCADSFNDNTAMLKYYLHRLTKNND